MFIWERPRLCDSAGERSSNAGAFTVEQKITDYLKIAKMRSPVKRAIELQKIRDGHTFDENANKDLETKSARGVESTLDYMDRRERGFASVNQKDNINSKYSQDAIENGLLAREVNNGIEYGVVWDKGGEVISINKGVTGSVAMYLPSKNGVPITRDGTMTHTHPSEFGNGKTAPIGAELRAFGHSFSGADLENHGAKQYREVRAVAREGIYSVVGQSARIPPDDLKGLNLGIRYQYESADDWGKHKIACAVLAGKINGIISATQRFGAESVKHDSSKGGFFNSEKCVALIAVQSKVEAEKYGLKYNFTANKGYENLGKVINSGVLEPVAVKNLSDNGIGKPMPVPNGRSPVDAKGNDVVSTKKSKFTEVPVKLTPKATPKVPPVTVKVKDKTVIVPPVKPTKSSLPKLSPLRYTII